MKPEADIVAWQVFGDCLVGYIRNHPRQSEFTQEIFQITSPLVELDVANKRAETRNTVYRLGTDYETWQALLDEFNY